MAITVISGGIGSSQTTVAPALPATASAGDLFICHAAEDGAGTFTWASPAVKIKDQALTGAVNTVAYFIASGGETAMPRVTSTVSERWEWNVWQIPAGEWHGTTPPEINTGVTGNNNAPNPGSIAPSWGAENNTAVLALCARDDSVANTITAYPSGYTTAQSDKNDITSAANAGGAAQIFASGATSYDPGAFTLSATETWIAYAVAIRPAAAGGGTTQSASAALLASAAIAAAAIATMGGSVALSATATLSPTARITAAIAAALNANATVATSARATLGGSAALSASASLDATAQVVKEVAASLSASASIAAAANITAAISAALSANATLAAAGVATLGGTAALEAVATLVAEGELLGVTVVGDAVIVFTDSMVAVLSHRDAVDAAILSDSSTEALIN